MGRLIYSVIGSLDGYLADRDGRFDWAVPDAEVMAFVTERAREVRTYLYGRRMYELMTVWEDDPAEEGVPGETAWAQVWQQARKVVYSTTLEDVTTRRTTLERSFDPDAVRALKQTSEGDLTVEGPTLAAHAFAAGLVDEVHVVAMPVVVGGGLRLYPDQRLDLRLVEEQRFGSGAVFLRYEVLGRADRP